MPAPSMNKAAGTLQASTSIGAGASLTFSVDASSVFEAQVQIAVTFGGSVSGTAGVQIDVYPGVGSGPTYDTVSSYEVVIAAVASTSKTMTVKLSTGMYRIMLTNLDGSNSVSGVSAIWSSISSIS